MEIDIDEDVSNLSRKEIQERRDKLRRDLKFSHFKQEFWNNTVSQLLKYRNALDERSYAIKNVCEVCGFKQSKDEVLRTLPDKRMVCKKCWNSVVEETLNRNILINSTGVPELDNACIELYRKTKLERLTKQRGIANEL